MTADPTDPATFVRDHTHIASVALLPSIRLRQASAPFLESRTTEGKLADRGISLPFWAFAWPGGIAMARYLLDRPEIVANRRVVDIGSGSGLVAIAAARVGAADVVANDIDPLAIAAIEANSALNEVSISTSLGDLLDQPNHRVLADADVVVSGDIAYDRPMAERAFRLLRQLAARDTAVYVGDPGRAHFPIEGLTRVAEYEVPVRRALELAECKRTVVSRVDPLTA